MPSWSWSRFFVVASDLFSGWTAPTLRNPLFICSTQIRHYAEYLIRWQRWESTLRKGLSALITNSLPRCIRQRKCPLHHIKSTVLIIRRGSGADFSTLLTLVSLHTSWGLHVKNRLQRTEYSYKWNRSGNIYFGMDPRRYYTALGFDSKKKKKERRRHVLQISEVLSATTSAQVMPPTLWLLALMHAKRRRVNLKCW